MIDPGAQVSQGKFGIDEELVEGRLGTDLDIEIAVQNSELTDLERQNILQKSGAASLFSTFSPAAKDHFNQKVFLIWRIGRIGDHLLNADGHVMVLIEELRQAVDSFIGSLRGQSEKMLEAAVQKLFQVLAEPAEEKKSQFTQKFFLIIDQYIEKFVVSQESFKSELLKPVNYPGESAAVQYLTDYREVKIEEMKQARGKLAKTLWD